MAMIYTYYVQWLRGCVKAIHKVLLYLKVVQQVKSTYRVGEVGS